MWSPAESPVLMQTLSKFHIPTQLSGIHIPVLLSHLSQTSQDQATDSQVSVCFSLKNSISWENEAQNLTLWAGCSSRVRHQTSEYRYLLVSQQSQYSHWRSSNQFCSLHVGFCYDQKCLYLGSCGLGESTQSLKETHAHFEQQREARQRQDAWGHLKKYLMPKTTERHFWSI